MSLTDVSGRDGFKAPPFNTTNYTNTIIIITHRVQQKTHSSISEIILHIKLPQILSTEGLAKIYQFLGGILTMCSRKMAHILPTYCRLSIVRNVHI